MNWPDLQRLAFDEIAPPLRDECQAAGIAFDTAFPEPKGMEEFRKKHSPAPPVTP